MICLVVKLSRASKWELRAGPFDLAPLMVCAHAESTE